MQESRAVTPDTPHAAQVLPCPPGERLQGRSRRVQPVTARRIPQGRALMRNTAFSFAQQIGAMALAILLVPYMLWSLGAERYGLWLILQLFNLLGLAYLAELGFAGAIVRYLARFHVEGDQTAFRGLLASGFALFVAIGVTMGAAVIVFANTLLPAAFPIAAAYREEMQLALTVIGFGLMAGFPSLVIKAYFAARQDLATTKIWELCDRVLFALGVFALLHWSTSLVLLVLFEQALALVLTVGFALLASRRSAGWFTLAPRFVARRHFRGVAGMSGSVFATNLVSQGFIRLPELFVGALLGPVTLTAYQLSTRIPRVIKTLQGSLNAAVMPHIAGLDAAGGAGGTARAEFALKGLRANYLLAVPLLLSCALLAPTLLSLWVGEEYRGLAGYMAGFAGFQALFLANNFCNATLVRQEHFRLFVRVQLAILAAFVAALTFGLEAIGLVFLVAAMIVAGLAMGLSVLVVFRQVHGLGLARVAGEALLGPVLISGLVGTVLLGPGAWLTSERQWLEGAAALTMGGLLYAGVFAVFILTPPERAALRGVVRRLRR